MYNLLDLLLAMGIAWALYGALIIAVRPEKKDKDSWTALAVLFCLTLPIIDNLLKPGKEAHILIQPLIYIARNVYYLTGSILWLYVRTLLQKQRIKWPLLIMHSLPFLAALIVFHSINRVSGQEISFMPPPGMGKMAGNPPPFYTRGIYTLNTLRDLGSYLSPAVYGIMALLIIRKHSIRIRDFYSRRNTGITLSWLKLLLIIIVLFNTVLLSAFIINFLPGTGPGLMSAPLRSLPSVLFVFFFSFFSREQKIPEDIRSDFDPEKYKKSALDEERTKKIFERLELKMKEDKPFLDPDLTLEILADNISVTKHHLSQVINSCTDNKFFSYVNNYRIMEIMAALDENRYPDMTILAVAFECGFRSSSAFYKQFKLTAGVTPRQYMQSNPTKKCI